MGRVDLSAGSQFAVLIFGIGSESEPTECKFVRQINERVKSVVEVSDLVGCVN